MKNRPQFSLQALHVALFAFIVLVLVLHDRYRVQKHEWEIGSLRREVEELTLQSDVMEERLLGHLRADRSSALEDRIDAMSSAVYSTNQEVQILQARVCAEADKR